MDEARVAKVEKLVKELNSVNEKVIQAKTNYDNAVAELKELGHASIEVGQEELTKMDTQIKNRMTSLDASFNNFREKYGSMLA